MSLFTIILQNELAMYNATECKCIDTSTKVGSYTTTCKHIYCTHMFGTYVWYIQFL